MAKKIEKDENPFINIVFNIAIPAILMMKGQKWLGLTAEISLIIALAFPVTYGVYDFVVRRKFNFISILGFVSVLLTGGIGLLQLPKEWIAFKEAAVPFIIGCAVLISQKTPYPLVKTLLFNEKMLNVERINEALREQHHNKRSLEKIFKKGTWMIFASFMLSTVLNFALAKYFIKSETGTAEFTEELGQMTAWSYPVIAVPSMIVMLVALWQLFTGIQKLTGLDLEAIIRNNHEEKKIANS